MEDRSASREAAPIAEPPSRGFLVIGTGFIADAHIAALRSRPDARLVGVMDVDRGRAMAAGRSNGGVRWGTDLSDALSWDGVDACIVCTPNDTHRQVGLAVAAAGKHLLIEKPLATTVDDALALAGAFARAGTVLMAGHTHRFYDYGRAVKGVIDAGTIGHPALVRLSLLGGWIWPDWGGWMIDPARSGGHALHNGVHLLDLVTWWIGADPVTVYARGQRQTSAHLEIYDYLEMIVGYHDGSTAICEMSRGHRPAGINRRDVMVIGTAGELSLPAGAGSATLLTERGTEQIPAVEGNGFARQISAFLDAVGGADPALPVADAVRAVTLGVAAEESMATGQPVSLPPRRLETGRP